MATKKTQSRKRLSPRPYPRSVAGPTFTDYPKGGGRKSNLAIGETTATRGRTIPPAAPPLRTGRPIPRKGPPIRKGARKR